MRRLLTPFVLGVALAAASIPSHATDAKLSAAGFTYLYGDPASSTVNPTIKAGSTATFRNAEPALVPHNVTSDTVGLFSSAILSPGQSGVVNNVALLAPGRYPFHCAVHSFMHGVLVVTA